MQATKLSEDTYRSAPPLPPFIPRRYRPGDTGTWSGHLPFANDLIAELRPTLLVELGTHYGESYFGFCQSVAEHRLPCLCYAVDDWRGDAHSLFYGEEVFDDVRRHNDTFYKAFSYLLRSSFDAALQQFGDETIDLLHIDGLHTYEAASHDFRTWLPKVKPGGVILLHDIAVRHADFGVWRLWNELASEFPETFAFSHGWGLGMVRKPGGDIEPAALRLLFDAPPGVQERVRHYYSMYASQLEGMLRSDVEQCGPLASSEFARLQSELAAANAERMVAAAEVSQLASERNEARRELKRLEQIVAAAKPRQANGDDSVIAALQKSLETERAIRAGIEGSLSWRVTRPARTLMRMLRTKLLARSNVAGT